MDAQATQQHIPLENVDITAQLHTRPARAPDHRAENEALAGLARTLAHQPEKMAQALADAALRLTGAHSAGLSLQQKKGDEPIFRWVATAGAFAKYAEGTMPRFFSPCGTVVERDAAILMHRPVQAYPSISQLDRPCEEVLLVPFRQEGAPVGTVWVVSHDGGKRFDAEDARIVTALTLFAEATFQTLARIEDLREADRRKDRFLAMLAHELRNPLAPVKLAVQVLRRLGVGTDPRALRSLDVVETQATQLAALVDDITDVTSIRTGKLSLRSEQTTVQEIVARAMEVAAPAVNARRHSIEVQVPDQPAPLQGDVMRLTQVLVNLVNNAAKYTTEGGSIRVSAAASPAGVEIRVRDNGVGIAPELTSRIFDMYMQVPLERRSGYSGLGIGLALVKQLVEMHGGQVQASSAGANLGSEFCVRLPSPAAACS